MRSVFHIRARHRPNRPSVDRTSKRDRWTTWRGGPRGHGPRAFSTRGAALTRTDTCAATLAGSLFQTDDPGSPRLVRKPEATSAPSLLVTFMKV